MPIEETIQLLKQEIEEIKDECKIYDTCTDGSYEACLSFKGYYVIQNEIKELSK